MFFVYCFLFFRDKTCYNEDVKSVFLKILPILFLVGASSVFYAFFYAEKVGAQVFRLFPESCEGGFDNPDRAAGVYQVSTLDPDFITTGNSAILFDGKSTQMICQSFRGDVLPNTLPKQIAIKIAWKYGYDKQVLRMEEEGVAVSASGTTVFIEESAPLEIAHDIDTPIADSTESGVVNASEAVVGDTVRIPEDQNSTLDDPDPSSSEGGIPPRESPVLSEDNASPLQIEEATQIVEPVPDVLSPTQEPAAFDGAIPPAGESSQEVSAPAPEPAPTPTQEASSVSSPDSGTVSFLEWFIARAYAEELAVGSSPESSSTALLVKTPLPEDSQSPVADQGQIVDASLLTSSTSPDTVLVSSLDEGSSASGTLLFNSETTLMASSASSSLTQEPAVFNEQVVRTSGPIEVLYSFDGDSWESAGFADPENYLEHTFPLVLASSTTWEELASVRVAIRTHAEINDVPLLILVDGMWLEVAYEDTVDDPHPMPSEYRGDVFLGSVTSDTKTALLVERPLRIGTTTASTTELWLREGFASSTSWKYVAGSERVASTTKIFFREGHIVWIGIDRALWVFNPLSDAFDSLSIDPVEPTEYLLSGPTGEKTVVYVTQPDDVVAFVEYVPVPLNLE